MSDDMLFQGLHKNKATCHINKRLIDFRSLGNMIFVVAILRVE